MLLHRRACELFVFFVADWIENVDFNDDVSRHCVEVEVRGQKSAIKAQPPLWLRSFAASSGIFFRRRSRNQLFQVFRRLSRGVWYFWVSSLLLTICARIPFTEKSSVLTIVYAVPTAAA